MEKWNIEKMENWKKQMKNTLLKKYKDDMDETVDNFDEFKEDKPTAFEIDAGSIDLDIPPEEIRFSLSRAEALKYEKRKESMLVCADLKKMAQKDSRNSR